jgi:hypothetical protein
LEIPSPLSEKDQSEAMPERKLSTAGENSTHVDFIEIPGGIRQHPTPSRRSPALYLLKINLLQLIIAPHRMIGKKCYNLS